MSTYLICHLQIPDGKPNAEVLDYLDKVEDTTKPFGARWLAQGPVHVVEGAWPGLVVMLEFASRADAQSWYDSPAYQKILPLRLNNTSADLIFVEGVGPDFTVAGFAKKLRAGMAAGPRV